MRVITLPVAATQGPGRPKFVGAYELGAGRTLIVTFEEGKLHVTPPNGGPPQPLFFQSGTTYAVGSAQSDRTVTFDVDADGAVTGFTVRDRGAVMELRKVK